MHTHQVPGQRMTPQRRLLFEIISKADCHLDAEELQQRARESGARISISTIYRNLQLFKKAGLVTERHFADDHHYYEVKGTAAHSHLVCRSCGRVLEIVSGLTDEMRKTVEDGAHFHVSDIEINVRGYCHECQDKQANE